MFITAMQFVFSNIIWILFVSVILWIVFVPQFNKVMNRPKKSQRFFVE